jgi:hypothetical protein
VNTEGFVLQVKVHNAKVLDQEGIKKLLQYADKKYPGLKKHLWLDALAIESKTKAKVGCRRWYRVELGARPTSAQTCPGEGALEAWAAPSGLRKAEKEVDWHKLSPGRGFQLLPQRLGQWSVLLLESATIEE